MSNEVKCGRNDTMLAIKVKAVIDGSHRLQIDLPADTPIGEAEVIVLVPQTATPESTRSLLALFQEIDGSARARLSAEDVERWIETERGAWD